MFPSITKEPRLRCLCPARGLVVQAKDVCSGLEERALFGGGPPLLLFA